MWCVDLYKNKYKCFIGTTTGAVTPVADGLRSIRLSLAQIPHARSLLPCTETWASTTARIPWPVWRTSSCQALPNGSTTSVTSRMHTYIFALPLLCGYRFINFFPLDFFWLLLNWPDTRMTTLVTSMSTCGTSSSRRCSPPWPKHLTWYIPWIVCFPTVCSHNTTPSSLSSDGSASLSSFGIGVSRQSRVLLPWPLLPALYCKLHCIQLSFQVIEGLLIGVCVYVCTLY